MAHNRPILHLDYETYSEVDIKAVGGFRYSRDPSTEVLCAALAFGHERPHVWQPEDGPLPSEYLEVLQDPNVLIYAHNAQFEIAISQSLMLKTWDIQCPALDRWRCTASFARRAALPAKLADLAITLGLPQKKDKRGEQLIRKFSIPQKPQKLTKKRLHPNTQPWRIYPYDDVTAFNQFMDYCRQDVVVEQEVAKALAYFDFEGTPADVYTFDCKMNCRGVSVNLDALHKAKKLKDEEIERIRTEFQKVTGLMPTQGAKFLNWLQVRRLKIDNLQAPTVETFLEEWDVPPWDSSDYVVALRMFQDINYASIKKIDKMITCAGPGDNRIRGMAIYHGATTGRWSASLVQFQNLRKSTIKHSEKAYRDICGGMDVEMLELCYGPILEVLASCIRHFVDNEVPILDVDYSSIEARIVAWLAGQEDALIDYRKGTDRYRVMAQVIFGISYDKVDKKGIHRFIAKAAVLGCGFGLGATKFRATCEKMIGVDKDPAIRAFRMPENMEVTVVKAWRQAHKQIVNFWYSLERQAKHAILEKGKVFQCGKVCFFSTDIAGTHFLLMRLPSGRKLAYPRPAITDDRISYYGAIAGRAQWGRIEIWGGLLAENATQAVAADIMAQGALNVEAKGYEIMTLIHDQALSYYRPEKGQTLEEFENCLKQLPEWAAGLPIETEGQIAPFYKKG